VAGPIGENRKERDIGGRSEMEADTKREESDEAGSASAGKKAEANIQEHHIRKIAGELGVEEGRVAATGRLLAEGATVPFIARYRKEATGTLDEVQITEIRDRLAQLDELDRRRDAIVKSLTERELLTDELAGKIAAAETLSVLEDIYLPFRPKRRTRATVAREKGLEPLAQSIFAQEASFDPAAAAAAFVDPDKGVASPDEALAGARDIIAEWVNENEQARARMREFFTAKAHFQSRVIPGKETEGSRYRDYFEWDEPAAKAPSHRILAMRRGEKEEFLTLRVVPPEPEAIALLTAMFVRGDHPAAQQVRSAVEDAYKRLLCGAMETEIRQTTKKRADREAIRVFADNLRQLLLAPPLGQKRLLAIDPGFRTGCKVVCLDAQGKLLHFDAVFPHLSDKARLEASEAIRKLCARFRVEAIAVGNGTAGRETEAFLRTIGLPETIQIVMVNESGASVYSASKIGREEFPNEDVTVRGAVSIGRRLADPLAELVKIEPKGQYQHDVDQNKLQNALDEVVVSCVNAVGVEVNTASSHLLTYVSGLGPQLARNIVDYRAENGPFTSRQELIQVKRMGAKAFEQSAGFLRIRNADNPLDSSSVHPESYHVVEKMAKDLGCDIKELITNDSKRKEIRLEKYVTPVTGLPTLKDIIEELAKPGRDPRSRIKEFRFADIHEMEDLTEGMVVPGIVTNITKFGAFVDIGIKQDGLVHISNLSRTYITDPSTVVKMHQHVMVRVISVDLDRKRIQLSMKDVDQKKP